MTNGDHSENDAKEGENCDGFDESTGKPFPHCEAGLTCKRTSDMCIPGACNTCVKKDDGHHSDSDETDHMIDTEQQCYQTKCGYVCPNYECPQEEQYFDLDTCMCFHSYQCEMMCEEGESLDPTEYCSCVPDSLLDDLYNTMSMFGVSGSVIGLQMAAISLVSASLI